jgi:hemerythrin-like domain-containing protein
MKRHEALAELSRDHHQGLFVAQRLTRGAPDARERFLAFWEPGGQEHFRIEEEVLLPLLARHRPADDPAIVRVLVEHVEIRRLAGQLDDLPALGKLLHDHIRHEERVLFALCEADLTDEELAAVAAAHPPPQPRS